LQFGRFGASSTLGAGADFGFQIQTSSLPNAGHVLFEDSLSGGQSTIYVEIPVGPNTQTVGLNVTGVSGQDGSDPPIVGQVALVDTDGTMLAYSNTLSGPVQTTPQSVMVAMQNAPVGGRLLVQISASGATLQPGAIGGSVGSSSGWNIPFILDVQRQDLQPPGAASSSGSGLGQGLLGTVVFVTPGLTGSSEQDFSAWTPGVAQSTTLTAGQRVEPAALSLSADPTLSATESTGEFNVRLPVGPLVSRSAGPVEPMLASAATDPTPPVNRHERALSQRIEGLGAGQSSDSSTHPLDEGAGEQLAHGSGPSGAPVVTVRGGGGFPLQVSAYGTAERADLAGLLATLPETGPSASRTDDTDDLAPDRPIELVPLPLSAAGDSEGFDYPNYLRAALGLALGLGLTSGSLFPDLVASVRTKLPRWRFPTFSGSSHVLSRSSPLRQSTLFRSWIRRLTHTRPT
jgi:hypothetical protein